MQERTDGRGVPGMCFHDISSVKQSILNVLVYDWLATQNSIFWYGTINCDSKRKHELLLTLWDFLEMRNAEQETLHTCTNSCTTVCQFTTSCQHPRANKLAVPFLRASEEKVQLKLLILLVEYKIELCTKEHTRWFYRSFKYKRTYKSLYKSRNKRQNGILAGFWKYLCQ